jgi:hypothetical protein
MATMGRGQDIPTSGTPHDRDMHSIAKVQKETWEAYEASDPGFAQVQNLIAELSHIVNNVGALTIGRGRSYTAGSFTLTQEKLGELTTGMLDYCRQNEKTATQGWQDMFSQYAADVEAANREQAGWDLLWDGLQIAAGALITVIGLGLTPFTGGFSLGLTVLGGALVIGGVNSAINHVSIATTGQQLNLAGMAGKAIGHWYDMNVAAPAADSGSWGVQFLAGAGSGVIQAVSETAQLNVKEIGDSIYTLATDSAARDQAWKQLQTTAGKILNGDAYTIGEVASVLIPGAAGIKFTRASSLLSPTKFPNPNTFTKTLPANSPGWTTKLTGTGATTIRKRFAPETKPAWIPRADNPPKPEDAHYGNPVTDHGFHRPYPPINDTNRRTFNLLADPDAPLGRSAEGAPLSKLEYDERFTDARIDPRTGHHRDIYPPNDGAVPGTRRDYHDLAAYVREHGDAVDRIGKETGKYLGVRRGGKPDSFEQRSLPVNSLEHPYFSYRLADNWPPGTENWAVEHSQIPPGFGRPGGGYQLLFRDQDGAEVTVRKLVRQGVLVDGGPVK